MNEATIMDSSAPCLVNPRAGSTAKWAGGPAARGSEVSSSSENGCPRCLAFGHLGKQDLGARFPVPFDAHSNGFSGGFNPVGSVKLSGSSWT